MPILTVIAGPNGSGKSTFTTRYKFEGKENLLDPDAIAKRMDPSNPAKAAVAAGRESIERTRHYLERGQSFAVETTLSGKGTLDLMEDARQHGFQVRLLYICLDSPDVNIRRVRERVSQGGHYVPDADVKRRFERSLRNLPAALKIAGEAILYDNSGEAARMVLEFRDGLITWQSPNLPAWAIPLQSP